MKRPNITPGDWTARKTDLGDGALWITGEPNDKKEASLVAVVSTGNPAHDENARAIAAVPALLAALEKCHAFLRELQTGGYCIDCDHEKDVTQAALTAAGYTF